MDRKEEIKQIAYDFTISKEDCKKLENRMLSLFGVSNSVICCPQCGNERLEETGVGWYICCDKDCDWGDKL